MVALRTRLSNQYDVKAKGKERIRHEGLWAGHSFDIKMMERASVRDAIGTGAVGGCEQICGIQHEEAVEEASKMGVLTNGRERG
jgi:hypothetical protein